MFVHLHLTQKIGPPKKPGTSTSDIFLGIPLNNETPGFFYTNQANTNQAYLLLYYHIAESLRLSNMRWTRLIRIHKEFNKMQVL